MSETQTNDAYSWPDHIDTTVAYAANGLNQYTSVSGAPYCYDANGNLTGDNLYAYQYDIENRLVEMRARVGASCPVVYTGEMKAQLKYDPLGRLYETTNYVGGVSQGAVQFVYDGDALVAEYNAAGAMLARHIHGPNAKSDDPLVSYVGAGVSPADRRHLYGDARGSIVLSTDANGGAAQINTYDGSEAERAQRGQYGQPAASNSGRFQYLGLPQASRKADWPPELMRGKPSERM